MRTTKSTIPGNSSHGSAAALVLREAKRLHRAAISDSLSTALPVLRRLLAAGAVPPARLPELFRRRSTLQRKHLLRTLGIEAGFTSWEAHRPALDRLAVSELRQLELAHQGASCLNLWFSSELEARAFAARHGGRPIRVGSQAVVLPAQDRPESGHHE